MSRSEDFISDILEGRQKAPADPVPLVKRLLAEPLPQAPRRTTPRPTPLPPMPRFEDVDAQLDPNMPSAQRDQIRQAFFVQNILPRIQPGFSIQGTFADFMRRTERPKIFGTAGRTLIRAGLLATQATKAMIPGVDLGANEQLLRQIADREGIGTTAPELVGQLAGMGISLETLGAATKALQGPMAAQLAKQFLMGEKKAQFVANVARGGFTFGAYDAMMAKDGDRVNAGLRGAAWGSAWELGLGAVLGKFGEKELKAASNSAVTSKIAQADTEWEDALGHVRPMTENEIREAETRIRERAEWDKAFRMPTVGEAPGLGERRPPTIPEMPPAAPTPPPPESGFPPTTTMSEAQIRNAEQAIRDRAEWERSMHQMSPPPVGGGVGFAASDVAQAEGYRTVVEAAKKKGFNTRPPVFSSGNKRGIVVSGKNADGSPFELTVKKGEEQDAYARLSGILDEGGSWDGTNADISKKSQGRVTELYRHFAEKLEGDEHGVRMRVENPSKANAAATVKQMNRLGIQATIVDEGTVLLGPKSERVLAKEAQNRAEALVKFLGKGGPKITVEALTGEADLANHRDLFELGRLRSLRDLPPDQRGFGSSGPGLQPGRQYADAVDQLAKQLSLRHSIESRYDVGQLGLRYFEDLIAENPTKTATEIIKDYQGLAAKAGIKPLEGEHPLRTATGILKGYRTGSPNSELAWSPTDQELRSAPGIIRERPGMRTKILEAPRERGLYGAVLPGEAGEDPMRVLSRNATRNDLTEENYHYGHIINGVSHADLELSNRTRSTAMDIIKGIQKKSPQLYSKLPGKQLLDEAFAKASTAIRLNDRAALDELAKWDTSIAHVKDFVRENSREMLQNITGDSVAHRAYQRRLNDLMRRTDPAITEALDQAAGQFGYQTWFDPELKKWIMRDGEGKEFWHNDLNDVWDRFHNMDPSVMFPDQAHSWFMQGMRSGAGMAGEGNAPNFTVPGTPDTPAPRIILGASAISHIWRPALDWAGKMQKRFDAAAPDAKIRFYDAWHALSAAARGAAGNRDDIAQEIDKAMKGFRYSQRKAYGEVLSRPEFTWATHGARLGLDASDLDRLRKLKELDTAHHAPGSGKVSIGDTLQKLWEFRQAGNDLDRVNWGGPVRDALKNGYLGHDFNISSVSQWVLRQNYESALGPELKDFQKLRTQMKNMPELQTIMDNYRGYVLNLPDTSQKWLNDFADGWQNAANRVRATMNKALPKSAQIPEFRFGAAWPTMRAVMYTAGLAGRASVAIRDTFQATYGMVAIGPAAFMRGMAMSLTPEGRRLADEAGALLHPRNVRQFFGDITSDLPTGGKVQSVINRTTDTLLAPSRIGHNIGRRAVFLGEYEQAVREITRFQQHGDAIQLAKRTSAWFHDSPEKSRLMALASAAKTPEQIQAAAKEFALSANLATQFGGAPGSALRTGLGRQFGQYSSWPLNHLEFTRKLATRALDTPSKGMPALGLWAAMNVGAYEGMKSMGIDVSKWVGISPMGFEGGPSWELAQHLMEAPAETDKGRAARKAILEFPLEFVPGKVEFDNVYQAVQSGEVDPVSLLGFKKYKEPAEELDLHEQIRKEFGFKPRP